MGASSLLNLSSHRKPFVCATVVTGQPFLGAILGKEIPPHAGAHGGNGSNLLALMECHRVANIAYGQELKTAALIGKHRCSNTTGAVALLSVKDGANRSKNSMTTWAPLQASTTRLTELIMKALTLRRTAGGLQKKNRPLIGGIEPERDTQKTEDIGPPAPKGTGAVIILEHSRLRRMPKKLWRDSRRRDKRSRRFLLAEEQIQ